MAILFKQLRSHLETLGDRTVKELTLLAIIDDQERRKRVKPWKAKSIVKPKVKKVRVKKEKKPRGMTIREMYNNCSSDYKKQYTVMGKSRKRKVKGGEGG